MELLQKQRERRSEARDWGQRAKALIADLPAGGLVVATDGGSNPEDRSKTGWGVIVVKKTTSGHPVVVAELFGPVTTDPYDDDYYIGSPTKDNDTAEMEASYQGLLWLWNNDTHVPAVIKPAHDNYMALVARLMRTCLQIAARLVA